MFSLENVMDLPLIWFALIAIALFLYVLLDGFDLGIGVLFPFAPTDECRDTMMHSIAPFWDANETWLVLSGGGLLAAFPLAYSVLMPALYMPVILMLLGLIFRGVAFEFRFKSRRSRPLWDYAFHFGSIGAVFMQGMILGAFVHGIKVEGRSYAGGAFDWVSAYSFMTGVALLFGNALLGSTWLVMKTEGVTQAWARKCASYVLGYVALFIAVVSISMPIMSARITHLWFSPPTLFYLLPIPIITAGLFIFVWRALHRGKEYSPFFASVAIFLMAYLGLGVSLWPWLVPFGISFREAAAAGSSQSFLLVGTVIILPVILTYTGFCYYVFRGKARNEETY